VAVAWSSSAGVALRYVLPVLQMTSRLAVMGATPKGDDRAATAISGVVIPGRSLMPINACLLLCIEQSGQTLDTIVQ